MRPHSRANRVAFRRAVGASLALHVVAACAFVLLLRSSEEPRPTQPGIDTRAADAPQVRMHFLEERDRQRGGSVHSRPHAHSGAGGRVGSGPRPFRAGTGACGIAPSAANTSA